MKDTKDFLQLLQTLEYYFSVKKVQLYQRKVYHLWYKLAQGRTLSITLVGYHPPDPHSPNKKAAPRTPGAGKILHLDS